MEVSMQNTVNRSKSSKVDKMTHLATSNNM